MTTQVCNPATLTGELTVSTPLLKLTVGAVTVTAALPAEAPMKAYFRFPAAS
ncbi:hypothetical protein D3C83_229270 [compost metagenome]